MSQKMINFKVSILNKSKRKSNSSNKIIAKGVIGLCKCIDGEFKFFREFENDENDEIRELKFTPSSYDVTGRTTVFSKHHKHNGRPVMVLREKEDAKFMGGNTQYQSLSDDWVVKGDVVIIKGEKMFEFKHLISKYNPNVIYRDEDYSNDEYCKW